MFEKNAVETQESVSRVPSLLGLNYSTTAFFDRFKMGSVRVVKTWIVFLKWELRLAIYETLIKITA